jgi:hypothetical protein
MEPRRTTETITLRRPLVLAAIGRVIEPGDYVVVTEEELIEGLSFPAFRRVSTVLFVRQGSRVEMVDVTPTDLLAAQDLEIGPSA